MEIGPIWRALMRSKTAYVLIALQIAVTMAIMVNAVAIIQERNRLMVRPSGVDEPNIFHLDSVSFALDYDHAAAVTQDLEAIRALPGVVDAIASNTVPLRNGGWSSGVAIEPGDDIDGTGVAMYFTDEHGIEAFGLNLIAGENFAATDIGWYGLSSTRWPPSGIISREAAATLFPDMPVHEVVGKTVYVNSDDPVRIVGIVERMQAAWKSWDGVERSMLVPAFLEGGGTRYVVRTEPGYRDELMPQVEQKLAEINDGRIIRDMMTMDETRQRSYHEDAAMIKLLVFIVSLLTAITALGIVGLASFSVARRTRQIGTRRALGASRPAILRYFMLENFMVSSVGIVVGGVLAVAMNIWMVQTFDLTPIAWYIIPAAMVVLWLVGQAAVYGPARRASLVPPAVATRSV
jgi:putative ABC transport system permease protein